MAQPQPPDHRVNNIDALRLILAVLVLFSHSYPLGIGSEEDEPLARLSGAQLTLGTLAVDGFFILSGFLIAPSWERSRSAASFLRKRVARIYPGFLVAAAVCFWVVVPLSRPEGFRIGPFRDLLGHLGDVLRLRFPESPGTFPTNPAPGAVNGSLWSIPYEFWCYIGVMVMGAVGLLRRRGLVLGLFVAAIGVSFVVEYRDLKPGGMILGRIFGYPPFWARLLPYYLAGVVAHLYRDRFRPDRRWALVALAGVLAATQVPHGVLFALPTLGTYLLLYLAFTTDWRWPGAAKYGDFSYGIYLYAFPIQQLIMRALGHPVQPWTLFALALVPTLLAGVASWYLVERHFLRPAPALPGGRDGGAPPGPEEAPPRRRRFRFTIGAMLLAVPLAASAILFGAGIEPFPRDYQREALAEATKWCRQADDNFFFDPFADDETDRSRSCLVKAYNVKDVVVVNKLRQANTCLVAVAGNGRCKVEHNIVNWAIQGGEGEIKPDKLAAIRTLIPKLPPSQRRIPAGPTVASGDKIPIAMGETRTVNRTVVVGFLGPAGWTTRTYDKQALPPTVVELFRLIEMNAD